MLNFATRSERPGAGCTKELSIAAAISAACVPSQNAQYQELDMRVRESSGKLCSCGDEERIVLPQIASTRLRFRKYAGTGSRTLLLMRSRSTGCPCSGRAIIVASSVLPSGAIAAGFGLRRRTACESFRLSSLRTASRSISAVAPNWTRLTKPPSYALPFCETIAATRSGEPS